METGAFGEAGIVEIFAHIEAALVAGDTKASANHPRNV